METAQRIKNVSMSEFLIWQPLGGKMRLNWQICLTELIEAILYITSCE